jgi:hypothetical protein
MTAVPHVYLCFDIDRHEQDRLDFIEARSACPTLFDVQDWSLPDRAPRGDWESAVLDHIDRNDLVIVLVGPETAADARVGREIGFAKRKNVPFFGVYVGGAASGTPLPAGLPANRTVALDWARIGTAIGQLMHEGKHHVFR